MFHHLDFPRLFLCESTGYSKHKTTGIASVAICGGSNHILTGLIAGPFDSDKNFLNVYTCSKFSLSKNDRTNCILFESILQ